MNIEELRARWTRALKRTVEANASDAPESHPTFGTVRQLNPLRISLDTAPTVWLGYSPPCVNTYPSYVGQRIWVETHGRQVVVLGVLATEGVYTVPPGSVTAYAGASTPAGWLLCDGGTFSSVTYPALATALGDVYGTHSGTTYHLPNLAGRIPVGQYSGYSGTTTIGNMDGEFDHALIEDEMPNHDGHVNQYGGAVEKYWSSGSSVLTSIPGSPNHGWMIQRGNELYPYYETAGGGSAHNNMPPYTVMTYIIKT